MDRVGLRLAGASFDVIYNSYMFDLIDVDEIPGVVAEFRRVLKPGGRLAMMAPCLEDAGFTDTHREYRRNRNWIPLNLLFGTEIVTARKPL